MENWYDFSQLGTKFSQMWGIGRKNRYQILTFAKYWNKIVTCENLVSYPHTCEELVPNPHTCEKLVPNRLLKLHISRVMRKLILHAQMLKMMRHDTSSHSDQINPFCIMKSVGPIFFHAYSYDPGQTGWISKQIWIFAERTVCHALNKTNTSTFMDGDLRANLHFVRPG